MKWIDITLTMEEGLPCWPGDRPFSHDITARRGVDGCRYNLSVVSMSVHFGTHLDAPYHYFNHGRQIQDLDLNLLIGPCQLVELAGGGGIITQQDLEEAVWPGTTRLLIKTSNSRRLRDREFYKAFPGISREAAQWLLRQGVRLLGIDAFSFAPYHDTDAVHEVFLAHNDAATIEGLDLSRVEAGVYWLVCLPIKIGGAGGAPARVVLGKEEY